MEVEILHSYLHCQTSVVELPKDKTTDDIKDVWIKWSEGHLVFKDESISLHDALPISIINDLMILKFMLMVHISIYPMRFINYA